MRIVVGVSNNNSSTDAQLYKIEVNGIYLEEVGFRDLRNKPLVSIKRKDGCLVVEIDDSKIINQENQQ